MTSDPLRRFPLVFALVAFWCVAPVALHTGCALFSSSATTDQKARDVQNLAYAAASLGTQSALLQNASWRPQFVSAYESLNTLVNSKVITGALLRQVLASLPVKELKSPQARLIIESATTLFDATAGTSIDLDKSVYLLAAATGIRDGLKVGLGL
jgi:hypothetical protein